MNIVMKKETRGGYRHGAGRKNEGFVPLHPIRVKPEQLAWLKTKGNVALFLRGLIDDEMKKENPTL